MVEFVISLLYWGLWAMLFLTVAFLVTAGYCVFQRVANWVATFEVEEPKSKSRPCRKSSRPRAKKAKKTSKRQEEDEEVPVWLLYIIGGIFALALAAAVLFGIYSAVKAVLQFLAPYMCFVWGVLGLIVLAIIVYGIEEESNSQTTPTPREIPQQGLSAPWSWIDEALEGWFEFYDKLTTVDYDWNDIPPWVDDSERETDFWGQLKE